MKDLVQAVLKVLEKIQHSTNSVTSASGIGCKPGCGACCSRPNSVWATIAEMLPMALDFHINEALKGAIEMTAMAANYEAQSDDPTSLIKPLFPGTGRSFVTTDRST